MTLRNFGRFLTHLPPTLHRHTLYYLELTVVTKFLTPFSKDRGVIYGRPLSMAVLTLLIS